MNEHFIQWVEDNKLDVEWEGNELSFNEKEGLLLEERSKVFSEDFTLVVNDEEKTLAKDKDYYIFNFGGKYWITPTDEIKKPKLNLFKYIGKVDQELDIPFVHLGVHGKYELLNGSREYSDWCDKAKFLGQEALGICEKDTLAGIMRFQLACEEADIKPILGETISVKKADGIIYDFKAFATSKEGWRNLLKINKALNITYTEEDDAIPEHEFLDYGAGLICIIPNEYPLELHTATKYNNHFEKAYFQIDTVRWSNAKFDEKYLKNIKRYFDQFMKKLEPILINDSYYLDKEDAHIKKILNKLGSVKFQNDSIDQYYKNLDDSFYILEPLFKETDDRLLDIFKKAVDNTIKLNESIDFKIKLGEFHLPEFIMEGLEDYDCDTNEDLFIKLIEEGLDRKIEEGRINKKEASKYVERIEKEYEIIEEGGFIDYFLILWDIIRWCETQDILVGHGRGSAAGSLISYLMNITKIDPFDYNLLFERFLNEGRIGKSLPDIDVDFESLRRKEVVEYIEHKYGKDYVCNVGTYTKLKIKSGIKDFGRIKGLNYKTINFLTNSLYFKENKDGDWEEIFFNAQKNKLMKDFIMENPGLIHDLYLIMNQPKAASIHPCATIVLPKYKKETLYDWIPLKTHDGLLVSEWEGEQLETAGFLKEDILGLHQLDKIKLTLNLIKDQLKKEIDIYTLPIDDQKVMQLFRDGRNGDVFQFGSPGLTAYSREVKPEGIEELIAMVSLYRPGPKESGAHFDYVSIRRGNKEPEYDFNLKEVTEKTYGLYIYQEQVMEAVARLGGFDPSETDDVRRAMGKKKEAVIKPYKIQFIEGAIKQGCPKEEAEKIWTKLEVFSGYGFNRSHAAAYSMIGYVSQYLKYYYPIQFWTSALQFAKEEEDILRYMSEINKTEGIEIVPPDINNSEIDLKTDHEIGKIYWSLSKIKFLGEVGIEALLEVRNEGGHFFNLEEFYKRIEKMELLDKLNKRMVINLILSGAFDEIEEITDITERLELIKQFHKMADTGDEIKVSDNEMKQKWWFLLKQKEISGIGTFDFTKMIKDSEYLKKVPKCLDLSLLQETEKGKKISFGGIIKNIQERYTQKASDFATVTIDSNNEEIPITFWNPEWEEHKDTLLQAEKEGGILLATGQVVVYREQKQIEIYLVSKRDTIEVLLGSKLDSITNKKANIIVQKGDTVELEDGTVGVIIKYSSNADIRIESDGKEVQTSKDKIIELVKSKE